jgi:hypothetical protein
MQGCIKAGVENQGRMWCCRVLFVCSEGEERECVRVKLVGRWELKRRRMLCKDVAEAGQEAGRRCRCKQCKEGKRLIRSFPIDRPTLKDERRKMTMLTSSNAFAFALRHQLLAGYNNRLVGLVAAVFAVQRLVSPRLEGNKCNQHSRRSEQTECAYLVHNRQTRSHRPQSLGRLFFLLLTALLTVFVLGCVFALHL